MKIIRKKFIIVAITCTLTDFSQCLTVKAANAQLSACY